RDIDLELVVLWKDLAAEQRQALPEADAAVQRVDAAATKVFRPKASEAVVDALATEIDGLQEALAAQYATYAALPPTDETRNTLNAIREQYSVARRTQKSIYRRNDNYVPETYRTMYERSRSGFALEKRHEGPHCSGVLIARDLGLTNHHCVADYSASELEA